ncbi:helix-turn-helix domain-containing protein [Streptomyces sp. 900105755]
MRRLDEALPLDELAPRARLSVRTLVRMSRQETGVSPHQWLLTARLNHARELLPTTA